MDLTNSRIEGRHTNIQIVEDDEIDELTIR